MTSQTHVSFAFKTQIEICLKIKTRLKRETQGAFGVLNANAKSQTRKSMKINVICTVPYKLIELHNLCLFTIYIQSNTGDKCP